MRSAIITTYQSSQTIAHVLESIKDIIDSVVIVDGRWLKDKQQISTMIQPSKIDINPVYVKFIESIESIIPNSSTDETLNICNTYKNQFKHFHIIVNNNKRINELASRTQALRYILNMQEKSSWIYIIDSDEIWTKNLKEEIKQIEDACLDDHPYRIQMRAKSFISLTKFYYCTYMRGFKNCSMLCDWFSNSNGIPFYSKLPKVPENSLTPKEYIKTNSYFLHYTVPSPSSHLLKALCYGAYGLQTFLKNLEQEEYSKYYMEYFGSDRKIEVKESLELIELGFK